MALKTAMGDIVVRLRGTERAGHCFYTDYIDTGFGPGLFDLHVIAEDNCGYDNGLLSHGRLLFGDPIVFSQTDYVPGVPAHRIGAFADNETGKFRVGLMLTEPAVKGEITLHWWAERFDDGKERHDDQPEKESVAESAQQGKEFFISTVPKALRVGQSFRFECKMPDGGAPEGRVTWSVMDPNAGTIDSNGVYTAPEHQGVFQIQAKLTGTDMISAIFIMVH